MSDKQSNGLTSKDSLQHSIIVIPTYNEAMNIAQLLEDILTIDERFDILVVDDNSPDGTANIVKDFIKETDRVQILEREGKLGLGTAYIAGFKTVLEQNYRYILQMDADFSHQPHYLPILLSIAEHQADVIIGSRYVRGGGVKNWSPLRQLISRGGSFYTRLILGLPIKDCTGGFKCFRKKVLDSIDFSQISSDGYSFQVEMNYQCHQNKFNILEFPIIFPDRVAGTSKMSGNIVKEAALRVLALRWQQFKNYYAPSAEPSEVFIQP